MADVQVLRCGELYTFNYDIIGAKEYHLFDASRKVFSSVIRD